MESKAVSRTDKGGSQVPTDFDTFHDFWKIPLDLVSYNRDYQEKLKDQIVIRSATVASRIPSRYFHWQDAHFFAPVFERAATIKPSANSILDQSGKIVNEINFNKEENTISFPFNFDVAVWNLRLEEYLGTENTQPIVSLARNSYYTVKPLLPRFLQMALRKGARHVMAKRSFPAWPVDTSVESLQFELMRTILLTRPGMSLPVVSFWPNGEDFCLVITHDVEKKRGYDQLSRLVEIESRLGFRSAWNFVPRSYAIENEILHQLEDNGFEIGIHGLYHDGKLFESWNTFSKQSVEINQYLNEWNSVGFRSPSLIRKLDWITEKIKAEYDTSYPNTEWYGAQPGGCCTVFPFEYGNMIELPITLQQDHTLLKILDLSPEKMVEHWLETIKTVRAVHGMVLINIHPDYMLDKRTMHAYEEFLKIIKLEYNYWHALPRDVARWWKDRQHLHVEFDNNKWVVMGQGKTIGKVMSVSLDEMDHFRVMIQPAIPDN